MIQVLFGYIGFACRFGTVKGNARDENKKARAFILFLGLIGVVFHNRYASRLYGQCLRISVSDAAMLTDATRLIRERADLAMADERKRWKESIEWRDEMTAQINQTLMEERTKNHRLETTIKEMMRLSEVADGPPCEACGLPVTDAENVGHECNLHPGCVEIPAPESAE